MSDSNAIVSKLYEKYIYNYRHSCISKYQADYIGQGIQKYKPKRFIEVGTSSGISGGYISNLMHENAGEEFVTLDILLEFKNIQPGNATTKPRLDKSIGHMINQMYSGEKVQVKQHLGNNSSMLLEAYGESSFDMGFIDASHVHPWPTLDSIATLPCLKANSRMYYHDVNLHKIAMLGNGARDIGVKHLFDQLPDLNKEISTKTDKNIGFVTLPNEGYVAFKDSLINALYISWTSPWRIGQSVIISYAKLAKKYWGEDLAMAILETANRYNFEQTYQFTSKDLE